MGTASDESGSVKVQGSAKEPYTVTAVRHTGETEPFKIKCTCPAYEFNGKTCKHDVNWKKITEWSKTALTCGARLRYEDGHFKCHAWIDAFTPCSHNQPTITSRSRRHVLTACGSCALSKSTSVPALGATSRAASASSAAPGRQTRS